MLISVRVIPRSTRNQLEWDGEVLKARLTAPPVDGAANQALIALLADQLAIPRRAISIVRGTTSRQKVVDIEQLTPAELEQRLTQTH
ncbi:DUF167 domain-containing protein [Dictyobacter aurantiacus]|uniref:UPF0235 protein KDAU_26870 n=1 Tax=Dictyobacter aurantiacus TaxID=1936993 RepID=A0A401ZF76_9CHLR|nr:DUF167 domain-containing protein [Dictyobacter aurantiacus]GCE05358.1 hypothetical protein KDAU_26870 [Dictyobacter aurantiacus]